MAEVKKEPEDFVVNEITLNGTILDYDVFNLGENVTQEKLSDVDCTQQVEQKQYTKQPRFVIDTTTAQNIINTEINENLLTEFKKLQDQCEINENLNCGVVEFESPSKDYAVTIKNHISQLFPLLNVSFSKDNDNIKFIVMPDTKLLYLSNFGLNIDELKLFGMFIQKGASAASLDIGHSLSKDQRTAAYRYLTQNYPNLDSKTCDIKHKNRHETSSNALNVSCVSSPIHLDRAVLFDIYSSLCDSYFNKCSYYYYYQSYNYLTHSMFIVRINI
jgi:hypothetical protein